MKVAYVSYDGPDDDREVLLAAWRAAGLSATAEYWADPAVDWAGFDAVVLRSPWDYILRRADFVAWAHRTAAVTRLLNPATVVERNTDKIYLRDLADRGFPIVPTHWCHPGEPASELPDHSEYVVKPTISAGARDTVRTADRAAAEAHAAALTAAGRVAMVQPYLDMVETEGELSLIYLGGRFSHARRRNAMLARGERPANHAGTVERRPDQGQLELAGRLLATVPEPLLYARVDLVRLPDGRPALIELELTEPYLYLSTTPGAAERLTEALLGLL
ncbi:ATP-grasp domain-containing protein [Sphaerisporangium rufum]|uniref:ATP-grasp domain-containing protein n=1 Tax=Sphaerisporangium rufum TaxID=1381558 RepID=A0A919R1W6_9ACTN|nr:hypothetical protein [Sphaerisporangium rufum]GII78219.1 ATP-grasp domain-containing protein [Sphaerisporangium rufum]